jgi:hypothetical protein
LDRIRRSTRGLSGSCSVICTVVCVPKRLIYHVYNIGALLVRKVTDILDEQSAYGVLN